MPPAPSVLTPHHRRALISQADKELQRASSSDALHPEGNTQDLSSPSSSSSSKKKKSRLKTVSPGKSVAVSSPLAREKQQSRLPDSLSASTTPESGGRHHTHHHGSSGGRLDAVLGKGGHTFRSFFLHPGGSSNVASPSPSPPMSSLSGHKRAASVDGVGGGANSQSQASLQVRSEGRGGGVSQCGVLLMPTYSCILRFSVLRCILRVFCTQVHSQRSSARFKR